jgi:hypothetical protein
MNWTRFVAIVIGAGVLSSLTDWLFAGDWIHRRWTYPEIWRKGSESRAIALTSPLPFLSCAIFTYAAVRIGLHTAPSLVKFAGVIWCVGPLPLILTNAAFIRMHRVFVAFQAVGWLVKLMIFAAGTFIYLQ